MAKTNNHALVKEKVNQAVGVLNDHNIDCWITFVRETALNGDPILDYTLGFDVTWHSAFIICRDGDSYALIGQYDKQAVVDTGAYQRVESYVEGIKPQLQGFLKAKDPQQIAINYSEGSEICDGITHGMFLTLQGYLAEIGMSERLMAADKVVAALRQRKSTTELAAMCEAIGFTEEIFTAVVAFIRPGQTEREIADFMIQQMQARGLEPAWEATVCPSVFTGPDTAGAHYGPTERKVEPGHLLNMDFGVRYQSYCSDLQRTFYVLREDEDQAPESVQNGFKVLTDSIERARALIKPGVRGLDVDKVARDTITAAGYEEFPHGLGHQVGRFAHDGTALLGPAWEKYAHKPFEPLEAGMVFTIEPRLTVPGHGVATVENMVLVGEDGAEYLSTPQTELMLIRG